MKANSIFKKSILAASIIAITACSGTSDETIGQANSKTVGVITGFGSIYVNGVKYETDSASVKIDGASSFETSLGVGDVITLEGIVNPDGTTGIATAVSCNDELEGYVLDVSGLLGDGTGNLNVMGQTVKITADTVFNSDTMASITELAAQDIVEVSGFPDGTGVILATRIETKNSAEDVEVKGVITALDTTALTFKIGGLSVSYSNASEVPSGLANGLFVEVKTNTALSGDLNTGFVLAAMKVELEDDDSDFDGAEGDEIEMQGVVSEINETGFNFNGTRVEFSSLDLEDNFDVNSLVSGAMITVEGHIDANGNFIVEEIEEEHESEDEVKGTVTAVTASSVAIIIDGITEKTFSVNNDTRMIDEQDENVVPLHYFSLADVKIGEYLEVEYYTDGNGNDIATEVEREDAPQG